VFPIEEDRQSAPTVEILVTPRACTWTIDVQDDQGGRRIPIFSSRLVVGSSPRGVDVVVRDETVSARHCAVSVLGTGVAIEDLGSKNGTFVGGARIKEAWAAAGTVVTVGRTTLTCSPVGGDLREDDEGAVTLRGVAGASVEMRRVAAQVRRLARHTAPVLIAGESGTGKELIARALHHEGPRAGQPFVAINVAALPRELVESEMFGHERGAFTGAVARRAGAFTEASGGTLFLDEIGELPLDAQPKLLRALDGYEVKRVGGTGSGRRADVRVVAATHAPLEERVAAGLFRRDLFHRLEVFVVELPPLRARRGDIPAIARQILDQLVGEIGPHALTSAAVARLVSHDWPGNVRELRNVLYRAADLSSAGSTIDAHDIAHAVHTRARREAKVELTPVVARALLAQHGNNLSAAARAAGYPRTTFRKLVKV
jgi:DNA-binding NtrC family response regulator